MSNRPDGKELMERLLSSESKGELLMLFHNNPGLVDSVDGVARRLGRHGSQIEEDVKDFQELGLFISVQAGKFSLIAFSKQRDAEIQASITKYITGGKA